MDVRVWIAAFAMTVVVLGGLFLFVSRGEADTEPSESVSPPAGATTTDGLCAASSDPQASTDCAGLSTSRPFAATGPSLETASHAAAVFATRMQHMMYANNDELTALLNLDTTDSGERDLRSLVRSDLVGVREALGSAPPATTWFVVRPLTVSVSDLDPTGGTATASVWSTQVFSRVGVTDPEQFFSVVDMGLRWDGSTWLLDGFLSRPGPAPRLGLDQYPVTAPELESRLDGHRILDPVLLTGVGM